MPDTHFELSMDEFVKNNLTWVTWVEFKNNTGNWETNQYDIKEARDYRVGFKVTNVGTETYAKNVQIRVKNVYEQRITFYSDDSFTQIVTRSDKTFPNMLAPGQFTPWHRVYFRLGVGPDEHGARVATVGVYAEIVPQGHYWKSFTASLD